MSFDGSKTVLVVDDEPAVRRLTATLLKRHGYAVIEADSGDQGLEQFTRHQGKVHVILSDVIMPRMSGPEMVGQIRAIDPSMPVLFMTGHAGFTGLPESVPVLAKPFTAAALMRTLSDAMSGAAH
ncbi:MAG TPA: response regulator [Candidatus Acidoferrales bacterium]|nr:response regulator [Candidatus Acidoferrales bacterium]HXK02952.1 response regulator [Verrucomicrobiae bacterium]